MKKIILISNCVECPHNKEDINRTMAVCKHHFPYRMICWLSELDDLDSIPNWCPLTDSKETDDAPPWT